VEVVRLEGWGGMNGGIWKGLGRVGMVKEFVNTASYMSRSKSCHMFNRAITAPQRVLFLIFSANSKRNLSNPSTILSLSER
jgi:hypothetical protein